MVAPAWSVGRFEKMQLYNQLKGRRQKGCRIALTLAFILFRMNVRGGGGVELINVDPRRAAAGGARVFST